MKFVFRHLYEVEYITVYAATKELAWDELKILVGVDASFNYWLMP